MKEVKTRISRQHSPRSRRPAGWLIFTRKTDNQ
jgi:hypothetical protein